MKTQLKPLLILSSVVAVMGIAGCVSADVEAQSLYVEPVVENTPA